VATDMEEVMGKDLMVPEAKETVSDKLSKLPLAASELKHAFFSWARQAGHTPTAKDAGAVAGVRKRRKPA